MICMQQQLFPDNSIIMPTRTVLPWKSFPCFPNLSTFSLPLDRRSEPLTRLKLPTARDLIVRDSGRKEWSSINELSRLGRSYGKDWLKIGLTTLAAASWSQSTMTSSRRRKIELPKVPVTCTIPEHLRSSRLCCVLYKYSVLVLLIHYHNFTYLAISFSTRKYHYNKRKVITSVGW